MDTAFISTCYPFQPWNTSIKDKDLYTRVNSTYCKYNNQGG